MFLSNMVMISLYTFINARLCTLASPAHSVHLDKVPDFGRRSPGPPTRGLQGRANLALIVGRAGRIDVGAGLSHGPRFRLDSGFLAANPRAPAIPSCPAARPPSPRAPHHPKETGRAIPWRRRPEWPLSCSSPKMRSPKPVASIMMALEESSAFAQPIIRPYGTRNELPHSKMEVFESAGTCSRGIEFRPIPLLRDGTRSANVTV